MAVLSGATRPTGINHVTYNVKDKDRALKWWEDILGIKQIPRQVNGDHLYWLQLPSGSMVHIIENEAGASEPSHHAAFEVDDIEAAQKALHDAGIDTEGPISTRNDGQKAFYLRDPDGNRVEICTKSGFDVLV